MNERNSSVKHSLADDTNLNNIKKNNNNNTIVQNCMISPLIGFASLSTHLCRRIFADASLSCQHIQGIIAAMRRIAFILLLLQFSSSPSSSISYWPRTAILALADWPNWLREASTAPMMTMTWGGGGGRVGFTVNHWYARCTPR